jgi:hypothetical protein
MAASDYGCARMDCGETATTVRITPFNEGSIGFYGACDEHFRPLEPDEDWLWAPRED